MAKASVGALTLSVPKRSCASCLPPGLWQSLLTLYNSSVSAATPGPRHYGSPRTCHRFLPRTTNVLHTRTILPLTDASPSTSWAREKGLLKVGFWLGAGLVFWAPGLAVPVGFLWYPPGTAPPCLWGYDIPARR